MKKKCPRCDSEKVARSRRRGVEVFLRVLPFSAYRCRHCWQRFWLFKNPFKHALKNRLVWLFIFLVILIFLAPYSFQALQPESREQETGPLEETAAIVESEPFTALLSPKPAGAYEKAEPEKVEPEAEQKDAGTFMKLGIIPKDSGKDFSLSLLAGSPILDYGSFYQDNPHRLVIDLGGKWDKPGRSEWKIDGRLVKTIRLAEHTDKLRIEMDLTEKIRTSSAFSESAKGLVITIKSSF